MRTLLLVFLVCLLPACSSFDASDEAISARSFNQSVLITNRTEARIYYFVVGRATSASINWVPHLNLDQSVARGRTASLRHAEIFRSPDEDEVIVFWWTRVRTVDGFRPGEVHGLVVAL